MGYYGKDYRKIAAWEQVNGQIPDGHCLIYLDKNNKENKTLENLACVSYSVMRAMTENNLFSNDPEITKAGIRVAEHRVAIRRAFERLVFERLVGKTISELPKEECKIKCKKCKKLKCAFFKFSLLRTPTPTCGKYKMPITEIEKLIALHNPKRVSYYRLRNKHSQPDAITGGIKNAMTRQGEK